MPEVYGLRALQDPTLNKATAFTEEERRRLRLRGLLPPTVCSQQVQMDRVLENLRRKASDIERYIFLLALQGRNERLFYKTLLDNIEEILPLIYTPTVGQACKEFAHIFRQPRGFYITARDRGSIREIMDNWPERDVRVIVVTDGQRILGLGDLGSNGMGIPIGKLALYSACAGIHPAHCLPVMLDVGTDNQSLRDDPLYRGLAMPRLRGADYIALVDEFVTAVQDAFPDALIQFEDFATPNAFELLRRFRHEVLCFNDDIQGTAAVALAGVIAATRLSGVEFKDLRVMFLGAGSAATGIADLMVQALIDEGLPRKEAYRRLWFVDIKGLVVNGRSDLAAHNEPYAHEHAPADFPGAIRSIRPHVLIGATGAPGTFTREALLLMAELNERPAVFALSNPTSQAECTAEEAYQWTDGRAIFASGSPFPSVQVGAKTFHPAQSNNVYIFPGVGLGAIACRSSRITQAMFLSAARALAAEVTDRHLEKGALYPPLSEIRHVSLGVAEAVARQAFDDGLAKPARPSDLRRAISEIMYDPSY